MRGPTKAFLCLLALLGGAAGALGQEYWRSLGPDGGGVYILEPHPADSATVYCGTWNQGFFVSEDRGRTWEARRRGLDGFYCWSIASPPSDPLTIYIGSGGVYKTTDMGRTWAPASNGLERLRQAVYALAIDATDERLVYAAAFWGLYRTTNAGESWEMTSLEEWTWDVEIDFSNPATLYAATKGGIYRSTDQGESWELKTSGLPALTFLALEQAPSDSLRLYAVGGSAYYSSKIYRTADRGETWVDVTDSLGVYHISDLVVSGRDPDEVYVAMDGHGVYKSTDGGESWRRASEGIEYDHLSSIALLPGSPEILFATDQYRGGVYRSTDGGGSWQESNSGIRLVAVANLQFVGEEGEVFLCTTWPDGFMKYYQDSARWEEVPIPCPNDEWSFSPVSDVGVDASDPSVVYLAADCGILKTTDGGTNWTNIYPLPGGDGYGATSISVHPLDPDQIASLTEEKTGEEYRYFFVKSTDGGLEWTKTELEWPPHHLVSDPTSLSVYYTISDHGYRNGVYKTTDAGATWTFLEVTSSGDDAVKDLIIDRGDPERLYAAVVSGLPGRRNEGIYRSEDGGAHWERLWQAPLPRWLAMDPLDPSILYCWSEFGPRIGPKVYKSTDGGQVWEEITLDVGELILWPVALSMEVDPGARNHLYVGTQDGGLLVLDQSQVGVGPNERKGGEASAREFRLSQNYPNPSNPGTVVDYVVPGSENLPVSIKIFDLHGRLVRALLEETQHAGAHSVVWDGRDERGRAVPSGVYFYRLRAGDFQATRKMALLR